MQGGDCKKERVLPENNHLGNEGAVIKPSVSLCLWMLRALEVDCWWSALEYRVKWKQFTLVYVQYLFLAKPQLWASWPILGRLNKPGCWSLKILGVGKLAFRSHNVSLLKPSFYITVLWSSGLLNLFIKANVEIFFLIFCGFVLEVLELISFTVVSSLLLWKRR